VYESQLAFSKGLSFDLGERSLRNPPADTYLEGCCLGNMLLQSIYNKDRIKACSLNRIGKMWV